jgi:predicted enzyme related to lactoylglutathione lyase
LAVSFCERTIQKRCINGTNSISVFSFFKQDNDYFPAEQKAMLNLQVDDLDGLLDRLIAEGVTVDPKRDSYDFGKFGWITDPAGNRIELWQPIAGE